MSGPGAMLNTCRHKGEADDASRYHVCIAQVTVLEIRYVSSEYLNPAERSSCCILRTAEPMGLLHLVVKQTPVLPDASQL